MDANIKQWIASRAVQSDAIPPFVLEIAKKVVGLFPHIREIWLIGSYADGTYRDTNTHENEISVLEGIGKRRALSDVDFFTIPPVIRIGLQIYNRKVDLLPSTNQGATKVLIYGGVQEDRQVGVYDGEQGVQGGSVDTGLPDNVGDRHFGSDAPRGG